jgi:hypothetical protein
MRLTPKRVLVFSLLGLAVLLAISLYIQRGYTLEQQLSLWLIIAEVVGWGALVLVDVVRYFLERSERENERDRQKMEFERRKPHFVVKPLDLESYEEVKQVIVYFDFAPDVKDKISQARFYFLNISNIGEDTAEEVKPVVHFPEKWPNRKMRLIMIYSQGKPFLTFKWPGKTLQEFEAHPERYSSSVLWDEGQHEKSVSLYGQGLPQDFALFFTLEKEPEGLKLCSYHNLGLKFPFHGPVELYIEAKGMPLKYITTYQIDAESWDAFTVKDIGSTIPAVPQS